MAQALTRVTKKYRNLVMCYVDDVVIARPTLEDQIDRLDEVLDTDMYVLGMYVPDTDALKVAISGILHQEQDWNGRTVFRPIA